MIQCTNLSMYQLFQIVIFIFYVVWTTWKGVPIQPDLNLNYYSIYLCAIDVGIS